MFDTKRNRRAKLAPFGLAINFAEFDHEEVAHRIAFQRCQIDAPDLVKKLSQWQQIDRYLRGGAATVKAISEATGIEPGQVRVVLNRGKDEHFVKLPDDTWGRAQPGQA